MKRGKGSKKAMANKVINRVLDHSLHEGSARLMMVILADQANGLGAGWSTRKRLMKLARIKNPQTITRILKRLEESGELVRSFRPGKRTRFIVVPGITQEEFTLAAVESFRVSTTKAADLWAENLDVLAEWFKKNGISGGDSTVTPQMGPGGDSTITPGGDSTITPPVTPQSPPIYPLNDPINDPPKKSKSKTYDPLTADLPFQDAAFAEAWGLFVASRKEHGKPLKPTAVKLQLKKLQGWGLQMATAALLESAANGWQGLFKPKTSPNGHSNGLNSPQEGQEEMASQTGFSL